MRDTSTLGMASLLEQVVGEDQAVSNRNDVDLTGERFGCGARNDHEKKACALYLWLLGPTTKQLATTCPCQG